MHVKPSALSILLRGDARELQVSAQDLHQSRKYAEERLGGYSNMKNDGPDIRFGSPLAVAVSDEARYVADSLNCRLVRIRLDCKEKKSRAVQVR